MKPLETKQLYERACRTKRLTPTEDEGRAWHKNLRQFEAIDVEAALDAWWGDRTPSGIDGRPRGCFLPSPAELIPMIEHAQTTREAKAREPRVEIQITCPGCGAFLSAFVRPGALAKLKCPCGGVKEVAA